DRVAGAAAPEQRGEYRARAEDEQEQLQFLTMAAKGGAEMVDQRGGDDGVGDEQGQRDDEIARSRGRMLRQRRAPRETTGEFTFDQGGRRPIRGQDKRACGAVLAVGT